MKEHIAQHTYSKRAGKFPLYATASSHSVGTHAGMHPEDMPSTTVDQHGDDEYDDVWPVRLNTSARPYQGVQSVRTPLQRPMSPVPPRSSAPQEGRQCSINGVPCVWSRGAWHRLQMHEDQPVYSSFQESYKQTEEHIPLQDNKQARRKKIRFKGRVHWLLPAGVGMIFMLLLWIGGMIADQWWQVKINDWTYSRPRTYTTDALVGHNDSVVNPSHFIVQNWEKRIVIIEFPGGDLSKAIIIQGPILIGDGSELTPVTLTFQDVNGDGKPDMIIHVGDQSFYMINDHVKFRAPRPGEVHP